MYSNHRMSIYTVSLNTMKLTNLAKLRFTQFSQVSFGQWTNNVTTLVHFVSKCSLVIPLTFFNMNIFKLYINFRALIH